MERIWIAGAGTMGSGICLVFARAGAFVRLYDVREEIVSSALTRLARELDRQVEKGRLSRREADETMGRIVGSASVADAADADFVLEAVTEDAALKKSLFAELNDICGPDCVFLSNTSSVPITEMAWASGRPDRFAGMHFFNPAPVMRLVEVICALGTSDATRDAVLDLARRLGKTPVTVQDSPGFVVNRILTPMINEAVGLLAEGVASAEDIDRAMCLGANHPMGPLALADLVGCDVVVTISDIFVKETGDSRYAAHPLLRKMVRAGKLGRKTGEGFYRYE